MSPQQQQGERRMDSTDRAGKVDLLLVEDNPSDAEFAFRALRKADSATRIAHVKDGAEALEFLFATGEFALRRGLPMPKVILLDLKLPKVDGIEVLRRLKGNAATRAIPVVVLTSSKEERDLRECYESGVNSYVVKPVNFETYSRVIGDLCRYWLDFNQTPVTSVVPA
jgi:CheY-like chemotaxis protein